MITVTKLADTNDGVCSGADCSLREAVILSNTCAGTQTVRIPAGTYTLTIAGAGEDAAATGDLDITDSASILGEGNPVIDGGNRDRVFEVFPPATVDMTGLIVQNGRNQDGGGIRNQGILRIHTSTIRNNTAPAAGGGGTFANGGGILNDLDGTLTLDDSEVSANTADQGGGIMIIANGKTSPNFELTRTSVSNNTTTGDGGGLWLDVGVHATLTRAQILSNHAGNRGDGIYNASTLVLNQSVLQDNSGGINGGGIYNEPAGDITARETLFQNNIARFGGGIYNKGPARFYQSLFVGNEAERGQGGAIYNFDTDSALTLDNTTLSENQAGLGGGAIRNDGGNFQITFATIALNEFAGDQRQRHGGNDDPRFDPGRQHRRQLRRHPAEFDRLQHRQRQHLRLHRTQRHGAHRAAPQSARGQRRPDPNPRSGLIQPGDRYGRPRPLRRDRPARRGPPAGPALRPGRVRIRRHSHAAGNLHSDPHRDGHPDPHACRHPDFGSDIPAVGIPPTQRSRLIISGITAQPAARRR